MDIERARAQKLTNWHKHKNKYRLYKIEYDKRPEVRARKHTLYLLRRIVSPHKFVHPGQRSLRLRFQILARDEFRCRYCGRTSLEVALHVDHIMPASKGGKTESQNLITACADCNIGKSDAILTASALNSLA
jgi:hypothetical protein